MEHTISGRYIYPGRWDLFVDNTKLDPNESLKVINHSPDGFSWGYYGSGPSQSALGILLFLSDEDTAVRNYMKFKFDHVVSWPESSDFDTTIDMTEYLT